MTTKNYNAELIKMVIENPEKYAEEKERYEEYIKTLCLEYPEGQKIELIENVSGVETDDTRGCVVGVDNYGCLEVSFDSGVLAYVQPGVDAIIKI